MRQIAAVVSKVVLGDPDAVVPEPLHLLHLGKHFLIELSNRTVKFGHVSWQVMRPELHRNRAHYVSNLQKNSSLIYRGAPAHSQRRAKRMQGRERSGNNGRFIWFFRLLCGQCVTFSLFCSPRSSEGHEGFGYFKLRTSCFSCPSW